MTDYLTEIRVTSTVMYDDLFEWDDAKAATNWLDHRAEKHEQDYYYSENSI